MTDAICRWIRFLWVFASVVVFVGGCVATQPEEIYDIVLQGGRVIDPASGLDAVQDVGIRDGGIAAVSTLPLNGERVIDATGLVVAPGFIDLHRHCQSEESYRLMVQDGVTTAFELELGTGDVAGGTPSARLARSSTTALG